HQRAPRRGRGAPRRVVSLPRPHRHDAQEGVRRSGNRGTPRLDSSPMHGFGRSVRLSVLAIAWLVGCAATEGRQPAETGPVLTGAGDASSGATDGIDVDLPERLDLGQGETADSGGDGGDAYGCTKVD